MECVKFYLPRKCLGASGWVEATHFVTGFRVLVHCFVESMVCGPWFL